MSVSSPFSNHCVIQGKKYPAKKKVSPISKLGTQGVTETPLKIIFDPRSSRGPQRLPESAI